MQIRFFFGSRVARIATRALDTPRPMSAHAVTVDADDARTLESVRVVCGIATACGADTCIRELAIPNDPCLGAEAILDGAGIDWDAVLRWLWVVATAPGSVPAPADVAEGLHVLLRSSDEVRGAVARALYKGALMLPVSFQIASPTCADAAAPV